MRVCTPCHRILTAWQQTVGVPLGKTPERTDLDRLRAAWVGMGDLFGLFAHHAGTGDPFPRQLARCMSERQAILEGQDRRWIVRPYLIPDLPAPAGATIDQKRRDILAAVFYGVTRFTYTPATGELIA